MLFAGLESVRILVVKNCDLGLENAALGLRSRADLGHSFSLYGPSSKAGAKRFVRKQKIDVRPVKCKFRDS